MALTYIYRYFKSSNADLKAKKYTMHILEINVNERDISILKSDGRANERL